MSNTQLGTASVCTTVLCKDGRTKVATMWATFNQLQQSEPAFNAATYRPTCQSIQNSLDAIDSWYADLIPFNPTCCTIDEIGAQAENLTNEMLRSVGATTVPLPPPPTDWSTVAIVGGVALLLIVYSPQIKGAFKK